MKRFLKFYQKNKKDIKMINQSDKGFELIVLNDKLIKELVEVINTCNKKGDDICVVWQMKFKNENYILYKNCIFSSPMDNFNPFAKTPEEKIQPFGKKFKVTCSDTTYYTESGIYKNRNVRMTKENYKDATLLERMLKISELNLKGESYGL